VSLITQSLGQADRVEPFRDYCTGLMLPVRRKRVEPMAAHLSPERVRSEDQRLHHFVADAPWSDPAVLDTVRSYALERIGRRAGPPEALIIEDTGFPKKGGHAFLTRGLPAPGRPCVSSAMCRTASQRCGWNLLLRCLPVSNGAHAAAGKSSSLLTQWC
jgi:SRSO17 transposase